jgi:hypothetical protein
LVVKAQALRLIEWDATNHLQSSKASASSYAWRPSNLSKTTEPRSNCVPIPAMQTNLTNVHKPYLPTNPKQENNQTKMKDNNDKQTKT